MHVVILGAPSSGKTTQGEFISSKYAIAQLVYADMLEDAFSRGLQAGGKAKAAMSEGRQVSDRVVMEIVDERITRLDCQNGFSLEGLPHSMEQV